jgi:hypothetical protein
MLGTGKNASIRLPFLSDRGIAREDLAAFYALEPSLVSVLPWVGNLWQIGLPRKPALAMINGMTHPVEAEMNGATVFVISQALLDRDYILSTDKMLPQGALTKPDREPLSVKGVKFQVVTESLDIKDTGATAYPRAEVLPYILQFQKRKDQLQEIEAPLPAYSVNEYTEKDFNRYLEFHRSVKAKGYVTTPKFMPPYDLLPSSLCWYFLAAFPDCMTHPLTSSQYYPPIIDIEAKLVDPAYLAKVLPGLMEAINKSHDLFPFLALRMHNNPQLMSAVVDIWAQRTKLSKHELTRILTP